MVFQGKMDFDDPNKTTQYLFRQSCQQGDLARVKELLLHNPTAGSQTLGLRDAVANSHIEVICFLLENNVIIDRYVVHEACSIEAFQLLFEHGLDIHQIMGLHEVSLMKVVEKDDETLLRWFLAQGADPNFGPDPDPGKISDNSPSAYIHTSGAVLEAAARTASPAIIDILLEHGAILQNSRAIHEAIFRETTTTDVIEMVEHLMKQGVDINQLAFSMTGLFWGGRPLTLAAGLGNMELIHWLLDHGANPTAGDRHGLPPCGFAKYYEHEEADRLLTDLYNKAVSEGKVNDSI